MEAIKKWKETGDKTDLEKIYKERETEKFNPKSKYRLVPKNPEINVHFPPHLNLDQIDNLKISNWINNSDLQKHPDEMIEVLTSLPDRIEFRKIGEISILDLFT